jgi:hypothetical protein
MLKRTTRPSDDFLTLTKTVCVDLPLAGMQWSWGNDMEETVTKTAWTGYDAGIRLAAAAIDNLYRLPLTAAMLRSVAPALLRWQRASNAVTGAMFAGLWRVVGLPTTVETRALREALTRLAADLRGQRQENDALLNVTTRIAQTLETETPSAPPSVFNGFVLDEPRLQPQALSAMHPHGN